MKKFSTPPIALTIAGSDSGGGAGIQADLKAFAALGCYGASVITALTAQNTRRVESIHPVEPDFIRAQIRVVMEDLGANAVKIGMLGTSAVIEAVAAELPRFASLPLVLDPVMVAKSGDLLLDPSAIRSLKERLIPHATLITPNLPEAEILLGRLIGSSDGQLDQAAVELLEFGPLAVLLKGGHRLGPPRDCLALRSGKGPELIHFTSARIETPNTHGTGCTLSAAIAAFLAHGCDLEESARNAKNYLFKAIESGARWAIGKGHGPVDHFWEKGYSLSS